MILPAAAERGIVVFHVWPSLAYRARLIASFSLIVVGLAVQIITGSLLSGVLLIAAGNVLLLVRGYDNRVDYETFDPTAEWERIDVRRLSDLRTLQRQMRQWDVSALDITNATGATCFVMVVLALGLIGYLAVSASNPLVLILVIDAAVLLLPHWLTGIRSILTLPKLMVKVEMIEGLLGELARWDPPGHTVQLLMMLRGHPAKIPGDVKFKVVPKDHHRDFLGMYGQVVLNEVQGSSYPYFYVVLAARKGFGLRDTWSAYTEPSNITAEFKPQDKVEVLVLRQTTTATSGYHTEFGTAAWILAQGLRLAEKAALAR